MHKTLTWYHFFIHGESNKKLWIMEVSGFDYARKNSLDNDCHHQKRGECECTNTWFWWCQRIIKQGCFQDYFNKHSKAKHCFKINTRLLQQTSIASRLIQDQAFASE